MSRSEKLCEGDYVLATKFGDGDPQDPFAVGFFHSMLGDRYLVVDDNGKQFRAGGFRRVEKISKYVGDAIVQNIPLIEQSDRSLWFWRRNIRTLLRKSDNIELAKRFCHFERSNRKPVISIEEVLGIVIEKQDEKDGRLSPKVQWSADAKKLPGSPPVGYGITKMEAKFDLLALLMWDRVLGGSYGSIVDHMLKSASEGRKG